MLLSIAFLGVLGFLTGAAGAFVAGAIHLAARKQRNRMLLRRGVPPYKDILFRPLWEVLGAAGAGVGVAAGALGGGVETALAGALVLPGLVALSSLLILRQGRVR